MLFSKSNPRPSTQDIETSVRHKKTVRYFPQNGVLVGTNSLNLISKKEQDLKLGRKYFRLWRIHVAHEKKRKDLLKKNEIMENKLIFLMNNLKDYRIPRKINDSLSGRNLVEKKLKPSKGEVFVNRLQAQKEIIEGQKSVIDQQNKIIVKMNKIKYENEPKLIPDDSQSVFVKEKKKTLLQPKPVPKIVQRIMDREEERKRRWEFMNMKKKEREKLIQEKLEQARVQKEEEKKRKVQEERRKKIMEEKEKQKLRKEVEEERTRQRERMRQLMNLAKEHDKKRLKRNILGIWRGQVKRTRELEIMFTHYYNTRLLDRIISSWKCHLTLMREVNLERAAEHNKTRLLRKYGRKWNLQYKRTQKRKQVLLSCCNRLLLRGILHDWKSEAIKSMMKTESDLQTARAFYKSKLLRVTFLKWKQLPSVNFELREREQRIRDWRSKVRLVLPDYDMDETNNFDL